MEASIDASILGESWRFQRRFRRRWWSSPVVPETCQGSPDWATGGLECTTSIKLVDRGERPVGKSNRVPPIMRVSISGSRQRVAFPLHSVRKRRRGLCHSIRDHIASHRQANLLPCKFSISISPCQPAITPSSHTVFRKWFWDNSRVVARSECGNWRQYSRASATASLWPACSSSPITAPSWR